MDASTRANRKLIVASLAGLVLFAALVWYASPGKILATLKTADYRLIVAAWFVTMFTTVLRTARFSLFVPLRGKVLRAYAVFSAARLLNMALPFRTGDIAMLAVLKQARVVTTMAHLLPVWVMLRLADALALAVWFTGMVALSTIGRQYLPLGIAVIGVALFALLFLDQAVRLLPLHLLENRDNWLVGRLRAIIEGIQSSKGTAKRFLASFVGLVIWGLLVFSSVLTQFAFGTPLDLWSAMLVAVFVYTFSVVPVNAPLGVGTGEVMWTAAMVLVGVSLDTAVPLAIGIRISVLAILILEGALGGALLLWLSRINGSTAGSAKNLRCKEIRSANYD